MKKFYSTIFLSGMALFLFAQSERKASLAGSQSVGCKSCTPQTSMVLDTVCNLEVDDTLAYYYVGSAPFDSGWVSGHNAYQDMAWAEKFTITGTANVVGGAYLLAERSGAATSGGTAIGKVYNTAGTGGKPGTSLGQANIPFASMSLSWPPTPTFFTFTLPISVTNSFYMVFELGTYTLGGPDTISIVTSKDGNRSTTNADQNCAQFSDNLWYFELTENFGLSLNYGLCAILDIASGVNDYVSKGDLNLYAAYPSPAASTVTINYSIVNASTTAIEIFDELGKSVQKINKGNLSAGKHIETIDVSSFASGNYFYNVSTENGTLYSRFSVVK